MHLTPFYVKPCIYNPKTMHSLSNKTHLSWQANATFTQKKQQKLYGGTVARDRQHSRSL